MLKFTLEGKTVLVTGASSGIGRGIAVACADAGAKCVLVARNRERLEDTLKLCKGGGHIIEEVDITEGVAIRQLIERLPTLDGLVQCAGMSDDHTPLKFLTSEFVDRVFNVNLKAPILFLASLSKSKKLNKSASVIMLSSIASYHASAAHSIYCATKGGITAFVRGAALDLAGRKIRVNAIAPGMVNTPLINFSALTEEQRQANESRYPLKRYGEPEDIAGMAVYLLSDAAAWVTGQQFVIDGGFTTGG